MKLLYVLEHISTVGGLERILIEKMNALAAEEGFDVVLMTVWRDGNRPAFPLDARVGQVCLDVKRPKSHLGWLAAMPRILCRYNKMVGTIVPDVVIHFRAIGAMLTAFSSWKGYTVFEAHTARHFSNHRWLYPLMECRADVVVCLTNGDARNYTKAKRVEVIPNFAQPSVNQPCDKGKRVLFAGRLCREKSPLRLVRMWKEIVGRHPGWQLDICGEGELDKEVRAEIERLCIEDSVQMHGRVSDISKMYAQSAMLVLCSKTEGLPMVLIEAMQCGVPVVSVDCPYGPADIIRNGENGFLVPMNDDDAFVDAVSTLIEDEALRKSMGIKAQETSERFSKEKVMHRWTELFLKR